MQIWGTMLLSYLARRLVLAPSIARRGFHTTSVAASDTNNELPQCKRWNARNEVIHPPEEPVNPYVVHYRPQVHYGLKKMLPITWKIRGLSIDEAIAQMEFDTRKGAKVLKQVLEEAQDLAVKKHNIEFRSNLWVAEAFAAKGASIFGLRRHAKCRIGEIEYRYCNIFVRLEQGQPPKHYYDPPLTVEQKLKQFSKELEDRYVMYSL